MERALKLLNHFWHFAMPEVGPLFVHDNCHCCNIKWCTNGLCSHLPTTQFILTFDISCHLWQPMMWLGLCLSCRGMDSWQSTMGRTCPTKLRTCEETQSISTGWVPDFLCLFCLVVNRNCIFFASDVFLRARLSSVAETTVCFPLLPN